MAARPIPAGRAAALIRAAVPPTCARQRRCSTPRPRSPNHARELSGRGRAAHRGGLTAAEAHALRERRGEGGAAPARRAGWGV